MRRLPTAMEIRRAVAEEDLFGTSYHEAGHAVVARHFGCDADAHVNPGVSQGGRTTVDWSRLNELERRMIALAGCIAAAMSVRHKLTSSEAAHSCAVGLSESDSRMAGAYSAADVDTCAALVRDLWPQIIAEAWRLREAYVAQEGRRP